MNTSLGQHAASAEHRLRRQQVGDVTWQSDAHAGVRERLGDDGQERRSRATQRRDRVQVALGQDDRAAEGLEEAQRGCLVLLACACAGCEHRHARLHQRRRIRHHANDGRVVRQALLQAREGDARGDRDDQVVGAHVGADLVQ